MTNMHLYEKPIMWIRRYATIWIQNLLSRSSSTGDMKSNLSPNFISTVSSSGLACHRSNGHVVEDTVGKITRSNTAPSGPADASESETDIVHVTSGISRKQIYLDGDLAKRKYEDMTSGGVEDVEAGNDHDDVSTKVSYFRERKKRRPPEAGNLMQAQETPADVVEGAPDEDQLQAGNSDSTRRSRSASGVELTPDICGESDLTAENHMAEESSRSSNNDGSSMFESAAESVSKGSHRGLRSVSGLGVTHCFLNHTNGGKDANMPPSSEGPIYMNRLLVKNAATDKISRQEMKDEMPKSEPAANHQLGSGHTALASVTTSGAVACQLWGGGNQEWLQLSLGACSNAGSEPASGEERKSSSSRQGEEERTIFKRKSTTSVDFPIAAGYEAYTNVFSQTSITAPRQWQFTRGSNVIPSQCEVSSRDSSPNLNPVNFRSEVMSSLTTNPAASEVVEGENRDLCIFGRRLIQTGTARQELVLAPLSCSGTSQSCSNVSEKDGGRVSSESLFELRRDQDNLKGCTFPNRDEHFNNVDRPGMSEFNNCRKPSISSSISTPITDVQVRSGQAAAAGSSMDHSSFQSHRDNEPSSSHSALHQTREDLHHGQGGYSWLPPPAAEPAPKLIPTAKNFQGWTASDLISTTKLAALENPVFDQQATSSDEWGSLFRKISPRMLFQSQCNLPEGPSSVLTQSAGHEANPGSQENLVALKRAIENIQKTPQWPIPPEGMNISVASWCLHGNLQGVRGDPKLEYFAGERPVMSSIPSESTDPLHSRFAGDHLNLREKQAQRQSWPPHPGHTKLHHGIANPLQRPSPDSSNAGKPKFQVPPPASRGANHAGLWFILQSAESQSKRVKRMRRQRLVDFMQNGDGGLPQISKAYLRIKDGKMPVSAVKKYLVSKLGLSSESEVEITCKGQPVVPSLPLQHVRDVIWFSSLNANNKKEETSSGDKEESTTSVSEQLSRPPVATDRTATSAGMFSKDILMVLTYRRHPRTLQLSKLLT